MFSQFRNAVENLAPQPHRGSDASALDEQHAPASSSHPRSSDLQALRQSSPLSSGQLAESALSNLRKSLATKRSGSPGPILNNAKDIPPDRETRLPKTNLEERLRATFAIGEASNATTPDASARASPSPMSSTKQHPLSPSSTPLPESPSCSPALEVDIPSTLTLLSPAIALPELPSPQIHSITLLPPNPLSPSVVDDIPPKDTEVDPLPLHVPERNTLMQDVSPETSAAFDSNIDGADVDALRQRLKLVEQRFADASVAFKKLQTGKAAADTVIHELTPLEGVEDVEGLRDYLRNMTLKNEVFQDEIKRLSGKLERQEDRIQELRDTHRMESNSQSDQIAKRRREVDEAEALFKASQDSISQLEYESAKQKAEIDRLHAEVGHSKVLAKEEEEKRVKAISLLKTVRQKLVKAEKEKEDVLKEAGALRERETGEREKEQAEKAKLQGEIATVNEEREKAVVGLRAQFDREVVNVKDRHEKEISALRAQFELEAIASKSTHTKELAAKNSQIQSLEHSLNSLSRDKNAFFDQLQLRQAELESSQSHLESLQSQNTELQYQLRESNDRLVLLHEDFAEARREQDNRSREPATSAEDVARLLSAAQAKYESKIADLKKNIHVIERERNEGEAEWSRKLRSNVRETEDLKRALESAAKTRKKREDIVVELKAEIVHLREEAGLHQTQISDLRLQNGKIKDFENSAKAHRLEFNTKVTVLERQLEECKSREAQLRVNNKTLREELRKVQSSAALLERQRNPGVGYWTSRADNTPSDARTSISSLSSDSRAGSPGPTSPTPVKNDEELNLEYLRNVILQFLEHKDMRPNLVRVLSIILHFTPQETRRLIAKV